MGCSGSKIQENNDNSNSNNKNGAKEPKTNMNKLNSIYNNDFLHNHYKVIERIGQGSFGKVFSATHLKTGQKRAIKVISKSMIKNQDDEKEFLKEIELLSQLNHQNIIKVYEYFLEDGVYYVVQELMTGGDIYETLKIKECFTEKDAAEIMKQLLSAVYYLHSMSIVHRDIKLENILINEENDSIEIKIIDFGTANYFEEDKFLTLKVGTSLYIAPEVIKKKYNEKCDIWSCGVILYILLSGYPPFDAETDEEIMEMILNEEVEYNLAEWEEISKPAIEFVKRMLTKKPEKRITAEKALKNKWLVETLNANAKEINFKNISSQIKNFEKFDSKYKLKNAIKAFMVHHLASEELTRDLKAIFTKMDASGDGRLSLEELKEGFKEIMKTHNRQDLISDDEMTKRFNSIDVDGSKFIEIEEFITVMINEEDIFNEKNLRVTFDYFDRDKSGELDAHEIGMLLNSRGSEEDKNTVKELIEKYDTNGDGVLSFEEFKALIIEFNPNLKK